MNDRASLRRRQARWPVDEDYVGGARPDVTARINTAHQFKAWKILYDKYEAAGTLSANKLLRACTRVYDHVDGTDSRKTATILLMT